MHAQDGRIESKKRFNTTSWFLSLGNFFLKLALDELDSFRFL